MKISIVLASYNGEKFIEKQLESLRLQSHIADEVIIIDDHSEDNTVMIIETYIQEHHLLNWSLFQQSSNKGYVRNFFEGLKKAHGDLIFLCDQDDIWHLEKIEKMQKMFKQNDEIKCLNSSFMYINKDDQILPIDDYQKNYNMLWNSVLTGELVKIDFNEVIYHNISMGCTMCFSKEIKDIYISYSNRTAPHDWEINTLAASQQGLFFVNDQLIDYRIHEHNTTGNDIVNVSNKNYRLINAKTLFSFIQCWDAYKDILLPEQFKICEELYDFHEHRLVLLEKRKKINWFIILKNIKTYRKIVSWKGILLDFFYNVKKNT